jgi:hypothetical protein
VLNEEGRFFEMKKVWISLPQNRKVILLEFLNLLSFLDAKKSFELSSYIFLGPVIVRPPDRSADALAVGEISITSKVISILVTMANQKILK